VLYAVVGCGCAGAAAEAVRVIWRSAQATLLARLSCSLALSLAGHSASTGAGDNERLSNLQERERESGRASRGDLRRGGPSDPSTGAAEADPRRMRRAPSSPLEKKTHTPRSRSTPESVRLLPLGLPDFHPVHNAYTCAFAKETLAFFNCIFLEIMFLINAVCEI